MIYSDYWVVILWNSSLKECWTRLVLQVKREIQKEPPALWNLILPPSQFCPYRLGHFYLGHFLKHGKTLTWSIKSWSDSIILCYRNTATVRWRWDFIIRGSNFVIFQIGLCQFWTNSSLYKGDPSGIFQSYQLISINSNWLKYEILVLDRFGSFCLDQRNIEKKTTLFISRKFFAVFFGILHRKGFWNRYSKIDST